MNNYRYTNTRDWFNGSELKRNILFLIDGNKKVDILEIGCYEGLSSVFFADNLLNHHESTMVCVDPFLSVADNDHKELLMNSEESNFDHNIKVCKNADKIVVQKITSDDFFKKNKKTYDFIYIDGCHEPDYITRDMENSFSVLNTNGIMWMDDYRGGKDNNIKNTMDKFLEKYKGQYRTIHDGYQLAIKKL
jgi:predicted O-methyltransferase YrrM